MGLTSWKGDALRSPDIGVAKNYLNEIELSTLNRLVSMYLDFAELQALSRKTMHMQDWLTKLDDFLRISEREILLHSGKVSHQGALEKARDEYSKYREQINALSPVEEHFFAAVKEIKKWGIFAAGLGLALWGASKAHLADKMSHIYQSIRKMF